MSTEAMNFMNRDLMWENLQENQRSDSPGFRKIERIDAYYPEGELVRSIHYIAIDSLKQGPATAIFVDGSRIEYEYKDDIKQGAATKWISNVNYIKFCYVNDNPKGRAEAYVNGENIEFNYVNGIGVSISN